MTDGSTKKPAVFPPKNETVWTGYYSPKGKVKYVVTSRPSRDLYYLYKVTDKNAEKLGRDASPLALTTKYKVLEKIRAK